ncbi:FAD-dependent oxidoreductase [Paenarthrobacter ilicis]|uniref:flavin-containing monooxygenase n=1 Tax=Paenarthrobacter ilicis TaxID=43665 RepID=UPI0028D8B8E1|nr:FAD-dependent oxidoreductase [Paenarthrobacter ilicis]
MRINTHGTIPALHIPADAVLDSSHIAWLYQASLITGRMAAAMEAHEVDTVIVGGGQAGLALAYWLAREGRDFVILDANARPGDAWRQRWDSLRLFTPAKYDSLPGVPFPGDRLDFPSKDTMADYLEDYVARFDLPFVGGCRVESIRSEAGMFRTEVLPADGTRQLWWSRNVVVSTGGHRMRRVPEFAGALDPGILQLHSDQYRNPQAIGDGGVLVVGLGNSGAEIAAELCRTHSTSLAGSPHGEMPMKHGRNAARFALPVVRFVGMHILNVNTPVGRKAAPAFRSMGAPLIRTKTKDLRAAGVTLVPRVAGVKGGLPVLQDGSLVNAGTVIWCTGYHEDYSWIELPAFNSQGVPRQTRGVADDVPGLYFLGQEFLFSAASATLPGVTRDARYLARQLAKGADREVSHISSAA